MMSGKLNGSSLVQTKETRKHSGSLTLLLTCLHTALTTCLFRSAPIVPKKPRGTINKIGSGSWEY